MYVYIYICIYLVMLYSLFIYIYIYIYVSNRESPGESRANDSQETTRMCSRPTQVVLRQGPVLHSLASESNPGKDKGGHSKGGHSESGGIAKSVKNIRCRLRISPAKERPWNSPAPALGVITLVSL